VEIVFHSFALWQGSPLRELLAFEHSPQEVVLVEKIKKIKIIQENSKNSRKFKIIQKIQKKFRKFKKIQKNQKKIEKIRKIRKNQK
jgi:hypothetical protein